MSFGSGKAGTGEGSWAPFIIGGLSGMGASAATHPIDLLKVRMQLAGEGPSASSSSSAAPPSSSASGAKAGAPLKPAQRVGMIKSGMDIARSEGMSALYKGLSASLLRQATYTTTRFGLYDYFRENITKGQSTFPFHQKLICSMAAGAGGAIVGSPADVVMVRMQADGRLPAHLRRGYKNVFDGIFRMVREEGLLSMFNGCGPNVVRGLLMTAGQLASYDQAKQMMLQTGIFEDNVATHLGASLFAALVACTVTSPVDVVKTRVMNSKGVYSSSLDCFVKTFKNEGIWAFYKGYIPYFLRLGPHTILTFLFVEQLNSIWGFIKSPSTKPKSP